MGKVLNIKDAATYDLLTELAVASGVSFAQALEGALGARLGDLELQRIEKIKTWIARVEANPLTDDCWVELEDQPMLEPDLL